MILCRDGLRLLDKGLISNLAHIRVFQPDLFLYIFLNLKLVFWKKIRILFNKIVTSACKDHSTRPNLSHAASSAYSLPTDCSGSYSLEKKFLFIKYKGGLISYGLAKQYF